MRDLRPLELDDAAIERVHTGEYVASFKALSDANGGALGDFAGFGPGSFEIAVASAGGVASAVRAVLDGEVNRAYALVRPPGHHAEPDRGRGYCLLANIPIAIETARVAQGVGRVAIVDWDVHHGNGAQRIYWDDPDVLAISLHQDRLYPVDSGSIEERGGDAATGANINIPIPAGAGAGAYFAAFDQVVEPALRAFRPELLIIASGYDAAFLDPSSQMALLADTYGDLTRRMMSIADDLCEGRLVIAQEGGYSPLYTPLCGASVIDALTEASVDLNDHYRSHRDTPEQELLPHQLEAIERAGAAAGVAPQQY
jgi:acetoin utilization deacetylase AcuC-like enzyme